MQEERTVKDVLIKFIDGESLTIVGASKYEDAGDSWRVNVEGRFLFFNKNQVKYIGQKFLIERGR